MKLQTKFILVLLSAILTAFVASQVFQQLLAGKALNRLSREDLGLMEQREQSHADNIFQTIDPVVQDSIARGEMPKLEALITNYSHIDGILDTTIYDGKGMSAYSTSRELLKSRKTLPPDLKNRLLA